MKRLWLGVVAVILAGAPVQAAGFQLFPKPALITLQAAEMPVRDVLARFGEAGGATLLVDDSVAGSIPVRFRETPIDQAFLMVALSAELAWRRQAEAIVVFPHERKASRPVAELLPVFRPD